MTTLLILGMMYLAVGAALFARPDPDRAEPADFGWHRQSEIFRATLPAVVAWPIALWRAQRD
jgi:hypothetical protein